MPLNCLSVEMRHVWQYTEEMPGLAHEVKSSIVLEFALERYSALTQIPFLSTSMSPKKSF